MTKLLEDNTGMIRAEIEIKSISENLFTGIIKQENFTQEQKLLFNEFEQTVNEHAFSLLDDIEAKIEGLGFKIKNEDASIYDLQVWSLNNLSYRVKEIEK